MSLKFSQKILDEGAISRTDKVLEESSLRDGIVKVAVADIRISNAWFYSPNYDRVLRWNYDIVEFNNDLMYANIQVTATPIRDTADEKTILLPPAEIIAEVTRRSPDLVELNIKGEFASKKVFPLKYQKDLSSADNYVYRNEFTMTVNSAILPPMAANNRTSFASVRRRDEDKLGPAESDMKLFDKNNFISKGSAVETGPDKDKDRPNPRSLFLAGGVDVLELRIPQDNQVNSEGNATKDKILIKSPADVFYYSGHGHSNLSDPPGVLRSLGSPLGPEEILSAWKNNNKIVKILIIAGCSVCSIYKIKGAGPIGPLGQLLDVYEFENKAYRTGVGMRWAKLLVSQGGPVESICGYWKGAPSDRNGGNEIAYEMGRVIAFDPNTSGVSKWIQVHLPKYIASSACGLSGNYFLYLEYRLERTDNIIP